MKQSENNFYNVYYWFSDYWIFEIQVGDLEEAIKIGNELKETDKVKVRIDEVKRIIRTVKYI